MHWCEFKDARSGRSVSPLLRTDRRHFRRGQRIRLDGSDWIILADSECFTWTHAVVDGHGTRLMVRVVRVVAAAAYRLRADKDVSFEWPSVPVGV